MRRFLLASLLLAASPAKPSASDVSGVYESAKGPKIYLLQGDGTLLLSFAQTWDGGQCYCLGHAKKGHGAGQFAFDSAGFDGGIDVADGNLSFHFTSTPACCSEGFKGLPKYPIASGATPSHCSVTARTTYLLDSDGEVTRNEVIRGDKIDVVVGASDREERVLCRFGKNKLLGLLRKDDVDCTPATSPKK